MGRLEPLALRRGSALPRRSARRPATTPALAAATSLVLLAAAASARATAAGSAPGRESLVLPAERTHGLVLELREAAPDDPPLDVASELGPRTGCFLVREIGSGRTVLEHGGASCRTVRPACSTLKVPLAAVAFRHGLFTSPDTRISWDGRPQRREVLERDLTPSSYLDLSANWVSVWIVDQLGAETVTSTLRELIPRSPPLTVVRPPEGGAVESGVELAPTEQVDFWTRLWTGELALSADAASHLRASLPTHRAGGLAVSGKTGSCCLDPGCEDGPGRQIGWFVGVAETPDTAYAFALELTDLEPTAGYAGAAAREIALRLLPRVLAAAPGE